MRNADVRNTRIFTELSPYSPEICVLKIPLNIFASRELTDFLAGMLRQRSLSMAILLRNINAIDHLTITRHFSAILLQSRKASVRGSIGPAAEPGRVNMALPRTSLLPYRNGACAVSGILKGAGIRNDPVSAQRHLVPRRARDDGCGSIQPDFGVTGRKSNRRSHRRCGGNCGASTRAARSPRPPCNADGPRSTGPAQPARDGRALSRSGSICLPAPG